MQIILPNYIPPPCQRPRLGKHGNAYSPSAKPEQSLAWMMISELNRQNVTCKLPYETPCYIDVQLFHDRKHSPRGDLDNIIKFIMDATQKAKIIANDKLYHDLHISSKPSDKVSTVITINFILFYKTAPIDPLRQQYYAPCCNMSGLPQQLIQCASAPESYYQ